MKLYLFLTLLLGTLYCKPEVERSQIPFIETFFGVFQSLTDTSVTLTYSTSSFLFTQNTAITTITPTTKGGITSCTANPTLPTGLNIDNNTCAISGTPTSTQAVTTYTITATNGKESTTATISISIDPVTTTPTSPSISFVSTSSSGSETVTTVSIPITISAASNSTVNYSVTGTATSGLDFTLSNGTLTFTSTGATTQNISITIQDDTLNELDETIVITLSAGTNSTLGANSTYTYTIIDDDPLPTVNFTAANQSVSESIGTATISVQLSAASGKSITIPFTVNTSSTATGFGSDYSIVSSPLTIPAGGTTASISISIIDDASFEPGETIVVDMGTPVNANAGANIVHTLTITDNDPPPTVAFNTTNSMNVEATTAVTIPVTLSTASTQTITVDYSVTGGTSTSGTDFTLISGTLTFAPGVASQNISLTVINDTTTELNETIILTLANPANATLGANSAYTYTITDDDFPTIAFTSAATTNSEATTSATIPITLSAVSTQPITIDYAVTGGTATAADFLLANGTLTFAAGTLTQNIALTISNDTLDELDETIIISISNPTNSTLGANTTHTYTITDDDAAPTVAFTTATQSTSEAGGTMTVTAQLSAASGLAVSVPYTINAASTATGGGTDYSITASPLSIAVGSTTATITITLTNDTMDEPDETVVIDMGTPTNATAFGTTSHTATITDDDAPPTISFTNVSQSASEAGGAMTVTAQLSTASGFAVSIPFTINGTSSATGGGTDYSITASPLNIAAGSTNATITINITNDTIDEPDETVVIDMGAPTNATASGTVSHTATITDDDTPPTVAFTAASQSASEAGGAITVTAQLSAASGFAVSIPFTINAASTAIGGGTDYSITASPLSIAAGSTTATITITPTNETLYEADETVIIDMGSPTNATASGTTSHTATIANDDTAPNISFTSGTAVSVGEGVGNYSLSATLSAVSGLAATVTLNTTNGTATSGSDYTAQVTQAFTIPAGSASATFNIPISDDSVYEGNETFTITISAPSHSTITGGNTQTLTITDNDIGITSAETLDCAGNGKIDHYKLTFTSAITDSTFPGYSLNNVGTATSDWLIAGYGGVALDHGTSVNTACSVTDTANDATIYLKFTEGGAFDTGAKPDLTTTATPIASGPAGSVIQIFTATVSEADTAKPVVTSITPANGTTSVLVSVNADATFSEVMNTGTFNSTNFYLTGAASVAGTVSTVSTTASRFDPTLLLAAFQSHTVTISGMTDVNGNTIVAFSSTFTTAPLNKVTGSINNTPTLNSGLIISNGTSSVNVAAGATTYQTTADILAGGTYTVTITGQPTAQHCTLIDTGTNLSGTAGTSDITVNINCVSGYVSGSGLIGLLAAPLDLHLYQGEVSTPVGSATAGYLEGTGGTAQFDWIMGICFDGQNYYVADYNRHVIRKVDSAGTTTLFAGIPGTAGNLSGIGVASFTNPFGLATDGTYLYVGDASGKRIKRILISNKSVDTIAGDFSDTPINGNTDSTVAANVRFNGFRGMLIDNGFMYIADRGNNAIRKLNMTTKEVTTLVSGGLLNQPEGITLLGNLVYTVQVGNHTVVETNKSTGASTILAGTSNTAGHIDAVGTSAQFNLPHGITTDGTALYIGDYTNNRIRRIDIASKKVSTIAGSGGSGFVDGVGVNAQLAAPRYMTYNGKGLVLGTSPSIRLIKNNGLVAYYPLSGSLNDYSGSVNLATVGTPTIGTGRFNETNGAVIIGSGNGLKTSTPPTANISNVTLTGWVKWDGTLPAEKQLLFYNGTTATNGYGLLLEASSSRLKLLLGGGATPFLNVSLTANTWTHLAIVESNGKWSAYMNGKKVLEITASANPPSNNLMIGTSSSVECFRGSITNVRLYTRSLNEGEINELAQNATSGLVGNSYSTAATGLLAHYPLDSGSNLSSGPIDVGLGGTSGSNFTGRNGDASGGREFIPTSSHIIKSASTLGLPTGAAPATVCAWASLNQLPPNVPLPNNTYVITNFGSSAGSSTIGIQIVNSGGVDQVGFLGYGPGDVFVNYKTTLNTWNHFCAIYDGANASLFVNGIQVIAPTARTLSIGSAFFTIGGQNPATQHFPGKIDDVRVYNNALSATSIRQLAAQVPTGLVARYDLNGDAQDSSGFGNHGTINGTITSVADRFNHSGMAYSFNGTIGNHISADDNLFPMGKTPRTLCAWYRKKSLGYTSAVLYGEESIYSMNSITLSDEHQIIYAAHSDDRWIDIPAFKNYIWRHVCVAYDGTNDTIYVNGKLMVGPVANSNRNTTSPTAMLRIGSYSAAAGAYFNGEVDEVLVYNRVLNSNEVAALSGYHPMQVSSWSTTLASSSLKFHLQTDSLDTTTTNVSLWKDTSGNGYDVSQATGIYQPTYASSSMNTKPSVRFTTASQTTLTRACEGNMLGPTVTLMGAIRETSTSGNNGIFQNGIYNGGGGGGMLLYIVSTLGIRQFALFNLLANGLTALSNSNMNPLNESAIFTVQHTGAGGSIYKNGANFLNGSWATGAYSCGPGVLSIGRYQYGPTHPEGGYFDGNIGDFLYFNSVLSSADRQLVECYLSSKYYIALEPGITCP